MIRRTVTLPAMTALSDPGLPPAVPSNARPVLSVRNYRKIYGDFVAVRECSFDVFPGDIVALVGPNGAGKTTTLRAICGILTPTSGSITVAGHDLRNNPVAAKAALAYVPDDPKLFDAMTVMEHLRFVASAYQVRDFEPSARSLLERFELSPKRDALTMELSRGMRQKLAIACAYLHNPSLILLDEPLTGLDPQGIRVMKDSIGERGAAGAGIVLSSHLLSLVEDLCTRVVIMVQGTVRFSGRLDEARAAFGGSGASLEDVFFTATQQPQSINPGPPPIAGGGAKQ